MVVELTGLVSRLDLQTEQSPGLARSPRGWCPEVLHDLVSKSADRTVVGVHHRGKATSQGQSNREKGAKTDKMLADSCDGSQLSRAARWMKHTSKRRMS